MFVNMNLENRAAASDFVTKIAMAKHVRTDREKSQETHDHPKPTGFFSRLKHGIPFLIVLLNRTFCILCYILLVVVYCVRIIHIFQFGTTSPQNEDIRIWTAWNNFT